MAVAALNYITEEEYLAKEEGAAEKHEYLAGRVYAMAGGTPEHAQISNNVGRELSNLAEGTGCIVYSSDLRIKVETTGLNTYPGISMVCGKLTTTDTKPVAAINPVLIVEVLSESTPNYDNGDKWSHYQAIPSLRDYLLVWPDRPEVEQYSRQNDNDACWAYRNTKGLDAEIQVQTLSHEVKMNRIYRDVVFPAAPILRAGKPHEDDQQSSNGNP